MSNWLNNLLGSYTCPLEASAPAAPVTRTHHTLPSDLLTLGLLLLPIGCRA